MTTKTKEVFKPEVAKAIADFIVSEKYDGDMTDDNARALLVAAHRIGDEVFEAGGKYAVLRDVPNARIMGAMIRGYVAEKTPEDEISLFYRSQKHLERNGSIAYVRDRAEGVTIGIRETLEILGIKIRGINA